MKKPPEYETLPEIFHYDLQHISPRVTITRFAPSPTGRLHLGHALAALLAWDQARAAGGRFLVRIEDIDPARCRPDFETGILEDLAWLGIEWDLPVWRQSDHLCSYASALAELRRRGLVYPCFCTRAAIQREIDSAGRAPHGPDGPLYPGICRNAAAAAPTFDPGTTGRSFAWRLDVAAATALAGPLTWHDRTRGTITAQPELLGDVVLARRDAPTSYHLAVTVDDAAQGVTLVTRGEDLLPSTHIHRLLQHLLTLPVPEWNHHRLVRDDSGQRLSKRHPALTLESLRSQGLTPAGIRSSLGLPPA